MDCWNIYWSGGIVYKSDVGLVWTAGTSAGAMESSIKVLKHQLELWNRYKSAGGLVWTAGTSAAVMESSQRQLKTLQHYTADITPPRAPVQVMVYTGDITLTSTLTSTSAAEKYIQPYIYKILPWTKPK